MYEYFSLFEKVFFSILLLLLIVFMFVCPYFCKNSKYTVVDHLGNTYHNMTMVTCSDNFAEFKNPNGKVLVVTGMFHYSEE